jgi:hypothetical protein
MDSWISLKKELNYLLKSDGETPSAFLKNLLKDWMSRSLFRKRFL